MIPDDSILDDFFHACAWRAFIEIGCETGQWPPDSEKTRRRAYRLYEDEKRGVDTSI